MALMTCIACSFSIATDAFVEKNRFNSVQRFDHLTSLCDP